jgi:F-type H+-transporting ATPase subunit b
MSTLLAASDSSSGSFLVQPGIGLMIWTLVVFGLALYLLRRLAWPRMTEFLDARQSEIEESIDHAERVRKDADELLHEYRERLKEAREQADEIIMRARKAGEEHDREARDEARKTHEEMLEQSRRDIQAETQRAISELRGEVANLTILATEKVTRRSLSADDQRRLVEDALSELDFSALSGDRSN